MPNKIISADSHATETPDTYRPRMSAKFRDQAPYVTHDPDRGDLFVIPGMKATAVPVGLIAAAGKKAEELRTTRARFEDLHAGGWDPNVRLADQDRDGIGGEILYPTVGMVLCNHPDFDYKKACFDAYNLWIAEYSAAHPDRLFGMGQTAMRSPAEGIEDLKRIRSLGLRGVMMPGNPALEDYDSRIYDAFYETAVELGMPLSFHILTSSSDGFYQTVGGGHYYLAADSPYRNFGTTNIDCCRCRGADGLVLPITTNTLHRSARAPELNHFLPFST